MDERQRGRVLGLLGLCRKAGKSGSGEFQCEDAIRKRRACLTLLAADASANTKKKFNDHCTFYQIPIIELDVTKEEMGKAMGQGERSCAVVCEKELAASIMRIIE